MYAKTEWKARKGTGLNKFTETERSGNTVVLTNTPDSVSVPGTPFSVENMNHIEHGIFEAHEANQALQGAITKEISDRTSALANHDDSGTAHAGIRAIINSLAELAASLLAKVNEKLDAGEKGAANGVATLNENGVIPASQIPNSGNGLLAVATDDQFTGTGTVTDPLKLANIALTAGSSDSNAPNAITTTIKALLQSIWNKLTWARNSINSLNSASKSIVNTVMYMTKTGLESQLNGQYGGTWIRKAAAVDRIQADLSYTKYDCTQTSNVPFEAGLINTFLIMPGCNLSGTFELYMDNTLIEKKVCVSCPCVFSGIIPAAGSTISIKNQGIFYAAYGRYVAIDVSVYAYVRVT